MQWNVPKILGNEQIDQIVRVGQCFTETLKCNVAILNA